MATKAPPVKAKARPKTAPAVSELMGDPWATPPVTTEERLNCIEALGKRILEHVRFMCAVEKMTGTSREAKDQAVILFYERLRSFELELNRVQEGLRLG
jgi:hypothetical protein